MLNYDAIVFEKFDNYQKQTYRNRTSIYGPNGKLDLNIPVIYSQKNRQLFQNVEIYNGEKWQLQHLKSIETAYRTSPFFEFYIDDLVQLFENTFTNLMDFNLSCLNLVIKCLELGLNYSFTENYQVDTYHNIDGRPLINARKEIPHQFERYAQVFEQKHGFISNLSILDLLFNEGPNTEIYLMAQNIKL